MKKLKNLLYDIKKIPLNPKHLYIYIKSSKKIKKKIISEISFKIKNYPKRSELKVGSMKGIHDEMKKHIVWH